MFSKAELSQLTGLEYEMTRSLERRNILTPQNGVYNYNQVIFGRVLRLVQNELNLRYINFANAFGVNPQEKIDFINQSIIFLINQENAIIPTIPKDQRNQFEIFWNEYLDKSLNEVMNDAIEGKIIPSGQEIISLNNGDNPSAEVIVENMLGAIIKGNINLCLIPLFKVRENLKLKAKEMKILFKIEQAASTAILKL